MRVLSSSTDPPFHHGYLAAAVQLESGGGGSGGGGSGGGAGGEGRKLEVGVVVAHLSPRSSSRRLEEAIALLKVVEDVEKELGLVFLVGDLNQLNPSDMCVKRAITLSAREKKLTRLCSHAPVAALFPVRVGQRGSRARVDLGSAKGGGWGAYVFCSPSQASGCVEE